MLTHSDRVDGAADAWPAGVVDALSAAMLVAAGSCVRGRLLLPLGLPLTLAGLYLAAQVMWRIDEHHFVDGRARLAWGLALLAIIGLLAPASVGGPAYNVLQRVYFIAGLATVLAWSRPGFSQRRWAIPILMGVGSLIHLAGPLWVPDPVIDNWAWTQSCLRALSNGVHPYTVQTADIIHGASYAGHSASIYPYMPVTLLAHMPSYMLFGDYRFLGAVTVPVSLVLMGAIGVRLGIPHDLVDIARLILLLHPRGFWLTCLGRLEPLMACMLITFAYLAIRRPGGLAQATAFLFIPALKQYFLAPTLLFIVMRKRTSIPVLLTAMLITTVGIVPFMWWNWRPTWAGMVTEMTATDGPRLDSTSLVALMATLTGTYPGRWLSAALQLAVGALAYAQVRRAGLAGLLLSSGLALLVTFLSAWQAFVNYFYPVSVTLVLAAMFLASRRPGLTPDEPWSV